MELSSISNSVLPLYAIGLQYAVCTRIGYARAIFIMLTHAMKIPKSGASRLSTNTWIEAEALRRYRQADSVRKAIEAEIAAATSRYMTDEKFVELLQQVRAEGVEAN